MTDLLFSCPATVKALVAAALLHTPNVIGPVPGHTAASLTDPVTQITTTIPAAGDATRLYYNARLADGEAAPTLPATCTSTDAATSEAIVGVWAGDAP